MNPVHNLQTLQNIELKPIQFFTGGEPKDSDISWSTAVRMIGQLGNVGKSHWIFTKFRKRLFGFLEKFGGKKKLLFAPLMK